MDELTTAIEALREETRARLGEAYAAAQPPDGDFEGFWRLAGHPAMAHTQWRGRKARGRPNARVGATGTAIVVGAEDQLGPAVGLEADATAHPSRRRLPAWLGAAWSVRSRILVPYVVLLALAVIASAPAHLADCPARRR